MKKFGHFIRTCRRELGLSLQDIADAMCISVAYVSEVERGIRPPFKRERFPELACALKIRPEDLDQAAWGDRGVIEFDPDNTSAKHLEALAALARGGTALTDTQLDRIIRIAQKLTPEDGI